MMSLLLDVLVALERDTALEALGDLLHVVLEAAQAGELARPDHDVVADEARLGGALDQRRSITMQPATVPIFAMLKTWRTSAVPSGLLDLGRGQQAFHRRADVVDGVVDDVVEADLDALALGERGGLAGRAHVEADDDRLRRDGEVDVALGDARRRPRGRW